MKILEITQGKSRFTPKKTLKTRPSKFDCNQVLEFVKNHNDKTLREIGENFKINPSSVFRILLLKKVVFIQIKRQK